MKGILQSLSAISIAAAIVLIIVGAVAVIGAICCAVLIPRVRHTAKKKPQEGTRSVFRSEPKPVKVEQPEPVEKIEEPVEKVEEQPVEKAEEKHGEAPVPQEAAVAPEVKAIIRKLPAAPEGKRYVQIRYNRSYTARLIQSGDTVKDYYTQIKNELLKYKGVRCRTSWKHETFKKGRSLLAKIRMRGKTLCLYLALNAADYEGTKYRVEDVSGVNSNAGVPVLYRIKNDRRCKYSKDLIVAVMEKNGLPAGEQLHENYSAQYPYEELEPLIERGLVKILEWTDNSASAEVGVIAVPENEIPAEARTFDPSRIVSDGGRTFLKIRYNRSYTAKIIQSGDTVKDYYSIIKNEILKYKNVKARTSWKHETFRRGRKLLIRLGVRGKTLSMYLAFNAGDYEGTKYKVEDVSHVARNAEVPALYRIKNDRRCKYAKDLIATVMAQNELVAGEAQNEDYKAQYPYEELQPLIDRRLVKLLKWNELAEGSEVGIIEMPAQEIPCGELLREISAAEAEETQLAGDIQSYQAVSVKYSDRTKKAIINIDTLGKYFKAGERVTLEEMKKRIPDIGKKVTYIKVLARGTLAKALVIEADDFSPAAAKMIILTGGMAVRKRG